MGRRRLLAPFSSAVKKLGACLSSLFGGCSHSDRAHALCTGICALFPVLISVSISLAPSLLQSHRVEELALVLWGGWSIGMFGGATSAFQTHVTWKRGSKMNPLDVICLELIFAALMLAIYPNMRSLSLVALVCGMLAMSSIVVELARSRIVYESLTLASTKANTATSSTRIILATSVMIVRHSVLFDIILSFCAIIVCLSLSEINRWAETHHQRQSNDTDDDSLLAKLPDLAVGFYLTSVMAVAAAIHFALVRGEARGDTTAHSTSVLKTPNAAIERSTVASGTSHPSNFIIGRQKRQAANRTSGFSRASLHIVPGRWLAIQASLSLFCLYGGRFLVSSLFASYYTHLPVFRVFNIGAKDSSSTTSSFSYSAISSACNVTLWSSALIGALLATNVVARWTAGRHDHNNDVALTRINMFGFAGVVVGPLLMCVVQNRAIAWIMLVVYSGFNGFSSVVSFAAYSRRLSLSQTTRVSTIKAAANGASGIIPFSCAALWTSGFDAAAAAVASSGGEPVSEVSSSTLKLSFMLSLAATGLIPLAMLTFIYRRQKNPTESSPQIDPREASVPSLSNTQAALIESNPFRDSKERAQGSDSEDDDMDLESYFIDYRLRQQRERLNEAAIAVEKQMALLSDEEDGLESDDGEDELDENSVLVR